MSDRESIEESACEEAQEEKSCYMYIVRCRDDSLYTGWTNHLAERVAAHNAGKGARYTKSRRPVELVYYETFEDRHEALSREWHIKRLSRAEKEKLIGAKPEE